MSVVENSKKVLLEMLHDRNYIDIEICGNNITCTDPKLKRNINIYFLLAKKKLPHLFKAYISQFENPKDIHHILILSKTPHTLFRRVSKEFSVELFYTNEFGYNITEHKLVPKHTLIRKNEIDTITDVANIHENCKHFPIIKLTDPIARYYGAMKDDLFKVERFSPCSGKYISYRVVQ
tara:strand:+ start:46 stop:579 length:534 start_codon:yes stop_codon:yes gene_type:complete